MLSLDHSTFGSKIDAALLAVLISILLIALS